MGMEVNNTNAKQTNEQRTRKGVYRWNFHLMCQGLLVACCKAGLAFLLSQVQIYRIDHGVRLPQL